MNAVRQGSNPPPPKGIIKPTPPKGHKGALAPHLSNEVRLVAAGTKPLAVLERKKDPYGYSLAIALSNVGSLSMVLVPGEDAEVVIVKPENSQLFGQYFSLLSGVERLGLTEYHRRMGRLFGYSEEDIEEFIQSEVSNQCNCNKCRGVV